MVKIKNLILLWKNMKGSIEQDSSFFNVITVCTEVAPVYKIVQTKNKITFKLKTI